MCSNDDLSHHESREAKKREHKEPSECDTETDEETRIRKKNIKTRMKRSDDQCIRV